MRYIIAISTPDRSGYVTHAPSTRDAKPPHITGRRALARTFDSEAAATKHAVSIGLRVTDDPRPDESTAMIEPVGELTKQPHFPVALSTDKH